MLSEDQPSSSQAQDSSSYNATEPPASSSFDMITSYSHRSASSSCLSGESAMFAFLYAYMDNFVIFRVFLKP